jgi:hypothetical protein
VINAGVPSYSPSLTYLQLRNGLLDFEPDLVIQAIDMSDVSDEVRYLALSEFDDQGELVRVRPRFIFDNLELNATLAQLRVYYTVTTRLTQSRYGYKKNDEELDHFIGMRDDTGMLAPMGWSLVRKYLSKTKWYMEEEKVMYLVVAVPRSLQVSASLVRKGDIDRYELPDYEGCCQEFFSLLAGMSDELGIEFVNPRETYYEHRDEELYYEADGHFAPRGQALMAEVLSSVVREKLCGEERNGLD